MICVPLTGDVVLKISATTSASASIFGIGGFDGVGITRLMSSAALRPSPVMQSMLSSSGLTMRERTFSAREASSDT